MSGFSSLEGAVVGVAVGTAGAAAIEPVLEPARQEAWKASIAKIQDLGVLARLVAQGLVTLDEVTDEAKRNGFTPNRLRQRVQLELMAAPVSELLQLWRRGEFGDPGSAAAHEFVNHGLAKAQIEPQYWAPIKTLFVGRLDPAVIATAIQRGIMTDPGFLPVGPPTGSGKVQPFPVSPLDTIAEARATGIDRERLFVETAIVGLPASNEQAASAFFRGIIEKDDYYRAIAEGNTRNEWRDAILEQAREILTPHNYAELQLRGYLSQAERNAGAAKRGMTNGDAQLLYDVLGRAVSVHQVTTGLARGGKYPSVYADVPEPFRAAIQRSNIREEWVGLAYANRYTYPSAFVLRSLAQAGDLGNAAAVQQILEEIGWKPALAEKVSAKWVPAGAVADPNVKKAEVQLWTTTHRSYIATESGDAEAQARFNLLGIPGAAQTRILELWASERGLIRAQLSPADIRKAYQQGDVNAATGTAWTHDDAIAAFLDRGWSMTDAESYLVIPYKG